MFFVYVDKIKTSFVIGGATTLDGAKELAENRANQELTWEPSAKGQVALVNFGTYSFTYRIEQGER